MKSFAKPKKYFNKRTTNVLNGMQNYFVTAIASITIISLILVIIFVPSDKIEQYVSTFVSSFRNANWVNRGKTNLEKIEVTASTTCNDPLWCNIKMIKKSYFNFDPPRDIQRWQWARNRAYQGNQILLEKISTYFAHPFDFLDGDDHFRKMHFLGDFFVDEKNWLSGVSKSHKQSPPQKPGSLFGRDNVEQWQKAGRSVTPRDYDMELASRASIVQVGYHAFDKNLNALFSGNNRGAIYISLASFLEEWKLIKNDIDKPFITMRVINSDWGWFSTHIPNRTAKWGECCDEPEALSLLLEFLNDDKTLMVIVNQHSNITHPKVLSLPRGDIGILLI